MAEDRTLLEIATFTVLLVLVSVQVVVYWSCTKDSTGTQLSYDQAIVFLDNYYSSPSGQEHTFNFSQVSTNCHKCSYSENVSVPYNTSNLLTNNTHHFIVSTTFPTKLHVTLHNSTRNVCSDIVQSFRQGSRYSYTIRYNESFRNNTECRLICLEKGNNAFLPILYAAVVIVTLSLLWVVLNFIHRYMKERGYLKYFHFSFIDRLTHRDLGLPTTLDSSVRRYRGGGSNDERHPILSSGFTSSDVGPTQSTVQATATSSVCVQLGETAKRRLVSLDTFRGMSLTIMIFVNYGGGGYWFFDHSIWNGLTVADLVFPWFIWIMGVSLVFSFRGRRKDSFRQQLYQVVRRTIILFAVGLFLNTSEDTPITKLRIPGVLQRFSITYFVVALTELFTVPLYQHIHRQYNVWNAVRDVFNNSVQWCLVVVLEALWLLLTFLLPVPGCPRGYLGAGGLSHSGQYSNCTGGAAGYIDRWILGNNHLYDSATAKDLYHLDLNYDPEGVLGSLNSIVLCFLGVQAGKTLLQFRGKNFAIFIRFLVWGLALSVLGAVLCLCQKNEGLIPLNKNLWSLSFILVMGGTGFLVLAVFYIVIDAMQLWNGSPFKYPGMNSIIVYVGHELLGSYFPFAVYGQEQQHMTFLTANLVATSLWLLISYYWAALKFFVKI